MEEGGGGEGTAWRGKLDVCMWWPGMATQHCVPCGQRQKSTNQTLSQQLVRLDAEAVSSSYHVSTLTSVGPTGTG